MGSARARFRPDVRIEKMALVCTSGWWEKENCDTVVRIVQEFAEDASAEFSGALLRPHASLLKRKGELTKDGANVLEAAKKAGRQLIEEGKMSPEVLEAVSRPLIPRDQMMRWLGQTG